MHANTGAREGKNMEKGVAEGLGRTSNLNASAESEMRYGLRCCAQD